MNESEGPSMVQGTDIVHKINSYQGRKTGKQKKDLVISLLLVFDTSPNSLTDIKIKESIYSKPNMPISDDKDLSYCFMSCIWIVHVNPENKHQLLTEIR